MTWNALKVLVSRKLAFGQTSYMPLDTLELGSPTDAEMERLFRLFIQESREILIRNTTLVVAQGDQTLDLLDTGFSPNPLFVVGSLWINGIPLSAYDADALGYYYPQHLFASESAPQGYAMGDMDGQLTLSSPVSSDFTSTEKTWQVSGFALHPPITADDQVLTLTRRAEEPASSYIAAKLAIPVLNEQKENSRVTSFASEAESWIAKRKASQILNLSMSPKIRMPSYAGTGYGGWR